MDGGLDVGHDGVRGGEVDDGIDTGEALFGERRSGVVLLNLDDLDGVTAHGCDLSDQRSGFARAQQHEPHCVLSMA